MDPVIPAGSDVPAGAPAPVPADTSTEQAPATKTAAVAAVDKGDVGAFRAARQAERAGKPLAAVPASVGKPAVAAGGDEVVDPAAPAVAERKVPKWQIERNEAIRQATERATADLQARVKELEGKEKPKAGDPAGEKPGDKDYQRLLKHPDAPKLTEFEAEENPYAAHAAAMSAFITSTLVAEQRTAAAEDAIATEAYTAEKQKIETFQGHITKAGGKAFLDALHPAVRALRPAEAIRAVAAAEGKTPTITALNVLTSAIVASGESSTSILKHLSDHPEELEVFNKAKNQAEVYILFGKLEARLNPLGAASPEKKTATGFTAVAHTLGQRPAAPADPIKKAVESGDVSAYRAARRAERQAQRGA